MYIYFLIKVKQIEIIFSRLNKQSEEIKGIKDEKKKIIQQKESTTLHGILSQIRLEVQSRCIIVFGR